MYVVISTSYKIIYKEITIRNIPNDLEKASTGKEHITFLLEFLRKILSTYHQIHVPALSDSSNYNYFLKACKANATGPHTTSMLTS